jgi:enoyl-CoA hydratase/carnithine racemase
MTNTDVAEPEGSGVKVQRAGGVVTVTLDRPRRKNSITPAGWLALTAAFRAVDPRVDRVLVLTGSGDDFCAGADLSAQQDRNVPAFERVGNVNDAVLALFRLSIPTVARVDGVAVGVGFSLAVCCDLVVASDRARFSQIFRKLALSPDGGGSWLIPRLVGLSRAKELALLGEMVSATDAANIGLVHRVVPIDQLDAATATIVDSLRTGPTTALGLTKALLNNAFDTTLQQALDDEARAVHINVTTPDAREAMLAFREKREPVFGSAAPEIG